MIAALAFVPGNDVNKFFSTLSGHIDQSLQIILDYLEDNYIGTVSVFHVGCSRPSTRYLPLTNNAVEGWYNFFNTNIGGHHVNFWKFMMVIKKEEDLSRVKICTPATGLCYRTEYMLQ